MATTMLNVYDMNRQKTAILQNAFSITETRELNQIYSLSFEIPATDEKVQYIQPFHLVRWGDDGELYRIINTELNDSDTPTLSVKCEHVIATLVDDLMFGAYQYGGGTIKTADVIRWLLSKQKTQNWTLAECDFDRRFEYNWEQENILNALYSVPREFSKAYQWKFNTTTYPWRLSLKAIDSSIHPEYYIRAKRNLLSSGTAQDYAGICTRIYPLGYGEGVNQLGIKEINNGLPYLQSPASIVAQYGIKEKVLVDRRFENAEALKEYAQTMLEALQTPSMSRSFDVVDLYPLTSQDIDNADVGKICKMTGDDTVAYVTKTTRVWDEPGNLQIELSTKATDVVSSIADLADRVRIESVYAQGATQLYQHSKDANATPDKGMVMSLYFPEEMRQINKVLLRLKLGKFRSYSQTTESNGGFSETYKVDDLKDQEITTQVNRENKKISISLSKINTTDMSQTSFKTTSGQGGTSNLKTSNDGGKNDLKTDNDGGKNDLKTDNDGGVANFTTEKDGGVTNFKTDRDGGVSNFSTDYDGGVSNFSTDYDGSVTNFTTNEDGGVSGQETVEGGGVDTETGEGGADTGETSVASGGGGISLGNVSVNVDIDYVGDAEWERTPYTSNTDLDIKMASNQGKHEHNVTISDGSTGMTTVGTTPYNHRHHFGRNADGTTDSYCYGYGKTDYSGAHTHDVWVDNGEETGHHHDIPRWTLKHKHTGSGSGTVQVNNSEAGQSGFSHSHNFKIKSHTHSFSLPNHTHAFTTPDHQHTFDTPDHQHTFDTPDHQHTFDLPDHQHIFDTPDHQHTFDLPDHQHVFDMPNHQHTFSTPNHQHTIDVGHQHKYDISHDHYFECPEHRHKLTIPGHSHTVTIPAHNHEIKAGIFESGNAKGFDIYVSGTRKATINATSYNDDISTWLLNAQNQIPRNTWIDVEIRPNDLAYVQSSVFVQGFVQSRGGGNY